METKNAAKTNTKKQSPQNLKPAIFFLNLLHPVWRCGAGDYFQQSVDEALNRIPVHYSVVILKKLFTKTLRPTISVTSESKINVFLTIRGKTLYTQQTQASAKRTF